MITLQLVVAAIVIGVLIAIGFYIVGGDEDDDDWTY